MSDESGKSASTFNVSEKGLHLIAKHAGFLKNSPKGDSKRILTIGSGHQDCPLERAQFEERA